MLRLISVPYFKKWIQPVIPICFVISLTLITYGLVGGLFLSPPDHQQGEGFRIIYVHVPCAFLSLGIYTFIFFASCAYLIWHLKIADLLAFSAAPLGAIFTVLALMTGALWGKPMWGTFWVWDARLTSELILLFLYLGYLGLRSAMQAHPWGSKACALIGVVGMINVPIVHYSVQWWNTLHQGPTLSKFEMPSIAPSMLYPLLAMIFGFTFLTVAYVLYAAKLELLKRELQEIC